MGIDAEMFVRVKRAVPDAEVRKLRVQLCTMFGAERFDIYRQQPGEARVEAPAVYEYGQSRHALERVPVYDQDGPEIIPEPGETFLRVYPCTRYYGIGYERGDWPFLSSLARALRLLTGGEVWYGGDSSGICAQPLDDAYDTQLWQHFTSEDGRSYYYYRSRGLGNERPVPACAFCGNVPMTQYAWGSGGALRRFQCYGCGLRVVSNDRGATWQECKEAS